MGSKVSTRKQEIHSEYCTVAQRYEIYFQVVKRTLFYTSEYVKQFLTRENEVHIFKLPCYVFSH